MEKLQYFKIKCEAYHKIIIKDQIRINLSICLYLCFSYINKNEVTYEGYIHNIYYRVIHSRLFAMEFMFAGVMV